MSPTHASHDHSLCTWLSPGNATPATSGQERYGAAGPPAISSAPEIDLGLSTLVPA